MYAAIIGTSGVDGLLLKLETGLKKNPAGLPKTTK